MTPPWQNVLSQINFRKLSGAADIKLARLPVTEDPDDIRFPVGIIATAPMQQDQQSGLLDDNGVAIPGVLIRAAISDGEIYTATVSLRGMMALSHDSRVKSLSPAVQIRPTSPPAPRGP